MYRLGRRAKTSLIIPILFLIVMIVNLIAQEAAYTQAVQQGRGTSLAPFDSVFFSLFLAKLVVIYIISFLFLSVETLIRIYITDRDSPQSLATAETIRSVPIPKILSAINTIELSEGTNKITHSVLFQLMMLVLAFFAATSSSSILGKGISLAIIVQIIIDQALLLKMKQSLSSWFWQIKASFPLQVHQVYFLVASILSLVCLFIAVR
jgi:hypothetical protein